MAGNSKKKNVHLFGRDSGDFESETVSNYYLYRACDRSSVRQNQNGGCNYHVDNMSITLTNYYRSKQRNEPITTQINYKARENARAQAIGFGFAPHWLNKWREFCWPMTERSDAKRKQKQFTVDRSNCCKPDAKQLL